MEIPSFVADLSPEEQVAWLDEHDVGAQPHRVWELYYIHNTYHKGLCCSSCEQDEYYYSDDFDGKCCCRALKEV